MITLMKAANISEKSVIFHHTTQSKNPKENHLLTHHHGNLKSHTGISDCACNAYVTSGSQKGKEKIPEYISGCNSSTQKNYSWNG
jgi:hypothetical protein